MKIITSLVLLSILVIIIPSAYAQQVETGVFEFNDIIDNNDGTFTMTTHKPYIDDFDGNFIPHRLIETDDFVQYETYFGKLVFDKNEGAVTTFDNTGIIIKSDSYVIRQALINTDEWNNLDVNNSTVSTTVEELENNDVIVTFYKENYEGIFKIEYIVSIGSVKTTAYFTNNFYETSKFAVTETLELDSPIITMFDDSYTIEEVEIINSDGISEIIEAQIYSDLIQTDIDLTDYVGQSFPREILEANSDMIIKTKDLLYNSGIGFDHLWSVNVVSATKLSLDYANVEETQTAIGETMELDPTVSYSASAGSSPQTISHASVNADSISTVTASTSGDNGNGYTMYFGGANGGYLKVFFESGGNQCDTGKITGNQGNDIGSFKYLRQSASCNLPSPNSSHFINQMANGASVLETEGCRYYGMNPPYDCWNPSTSWGSRVMAYTYTPSSTVSTAPQSLTIDTQDVANEITLNWLAPSDDGGASISAYKVYLGGSLIATTGNVLTYDDTISGGEIGASLVYTVKAVNSVGDSSASNTATVTSWNVPSQVTGLSGTSGSSPSLSWSAPSSEASITNYKIYRGGSLHDTIGATTSYSDSTSIVSGTTYSYTVSAVSGVGEGAQSGSTSVVAGVPADPPTNVQAVISDPNSAPLAVTITYTNPTNVGTGTLTGFQLLRNGTAVSTVGLTNSISDTAPSGGNVFTYTVKSLSSHGTGTASSGSSVTTPNSPDQVTGLTVTPVSTSRIDLSWNTPSDNNSQLSGYKVQISSNGGSSYSDVLTGNVNTVYQALSLNGNAQYHFKVSAINAVGTGTASDVKNTYTMTTTPASLSATSVSQVQINLAWGNSTGATGYKIEYESPVDNGFTTLVNNTGNTDLTRSITSLTTGTQYNFKVSGWNNGGTSVASPEASAYTWGILQAPVIDTITRLSPTSLKVDWTTGTGLPVATGYKIERQLGTGWTILANNTGTTDVTYTDSTLSSDQSATYRLYAINTIGTSPVSNEKSSDAIASSGGGGGSSSSRAVSSQTGVSGLIDLTFIDQIHRVVLGQLLSKSINVAWDSSDNLEVKSIIVSDSPFRIVFQDVPFVLIGDPSGISNGKINYSVQIPSELCTQQGQLNCVEQKQYEVPVEIQSVHKGSTLTKSSVIKIDLAGGSDIPLVFVLLAIGAVPLAFIIRKVGSGKSRRKASGSSHKSSKNGSNSKKVSL